MKPGQIGILISVALIVLGLAFSQQFMTLLHGLLL